MSEPIWIDHEDDPYEEQEHDVSGLEQLRPGDIGFTNIGGAAGAGIWLGQKIVDATTKEESRFKHVFVVTDSLVHTGKTMIVEAMPSGARLVSLDGAERWSPAFVYIRPRYSPHGLEMSERVAAAARGYIGTPYSFLDYAAIAGRHVLGKEPTDRTLFDRYITNTGHQICSQLADQSMSDAGWHVFTDGRLPQDVVPSALYRQMMRMPGQFIVGGTNVWLPTYSRPRR